MACHSVAMVLTDSRSVSQLSSGRLDQYASRRVKQSHFIW